MSQAERQCKLCRALLVEDDPGYADLVREGIAQDPSHSVSLQVAGSLAAALAVIDSMPLDIILLDLGLPDSSGVATFERIRKAAPVTPVVVLTAQDDPAVGAKCIELGAQNYLIKGRVESIISGAIKNAVACATALTATHDSHENLKLVLDCSADGVVVLDDGGLVKLTNLAARTLFGRDVAEGRHIGHFLDTSQTHELDVPQGDGSVVIVETSTREATWFGRRAKIVTFRDITERKRTEAELQEKNAELAKLNDLKNHFLGMAAHDLRHPLGIISTCSELLLEEAVGSLSEQHLQFLEFIQTSSSFMFSLLTDLLDIAKIEAGKLDLDVQPTDLVDLIRRVVSLSQMLADRKGIQIRLLDCESLPPVPLDALKMEQVLNNLISNAVKFSASGTTVSIQVRPCSDRVTVSVSDQGPGIPEQDLAKLFQPFSKISMQAPDGQESTGLGLAIVRKIVLGHHGEIGVDSEVGRGSTFHFSLPLAQGASDQ